LGLLPQFSGEQLPPVLEAQWARLRAKIEANAHLLETQGTLVSKKVRGKLVWRLRFCEPQPDQGMVRRTFYVGKHPELVERVRRMLARLRQDQEFARETDQLLKHALAAGATLRRRLKREATAQRQAAKR
jgi:hypothetical protein